MKRCPQCTMLYPNEATYCFVDGGDLEKMPDPYLGKIVGGRYRAEQRVAEEAPIFRAGDILDDTVCTLKVLSVCWRS
jgi:hypothetical protein